MATLSKIYMLKFIEEIKKNNIPQSLYYLFKKIKTKAIEKGLKYDDPTFLNLTILRSVFTPNDLAILISHYQSKPDKQLTIF